MIITLWIDEPSYKLHAKEQDGDCASVAAALREDCQRALLTHDFAASATWILNQNEDDVTPHNISIIDQYITLPDEEVTAS